ncbi:MAG: uracil-DNA glycosylase [Armatimonadota bacterium]|nr:uracil-DNA glycosylase [Armatimonadota bacterium]MCX7778297.1 uracil-DNA glycosylase [Armatimonadota bacterium]MDW8026315.1 uracil-DNA glycosylase [Armatimonadota bacterium]
MKDERNEAIEALMQLHSQILECRRCPLWKTRTNAVPGEGRLDAKIMFVGEGPGNQEDRQGRPFVGPAGRFLNELLGIAGLRREDVFITNVLKCRPPDPLNPEKVRKPTTDEVEACRDYLIAQIALIKPKVICLLGDTALKVLLDRSMSISKVHAHPFVKSGIVYVPLYHPAAALHKESLKDVLKQDMLKLREIIDMVMQAETDATHVGIEKQATSI